MFSGCEKNNILYVADAAAIHCLFSKIQIDFTFLVLAHPGSPGQRAVEQVCVCVLKFDSIAYLYSRFQEFMVRLMVEQNRIGQILQAGSQLLADSTMTEDSARQIEAQMSLLNTHWENLRVHAMDRQTRYHAVQCAVK